MSLTSFVQQLVGHPSPPVCTVHLSILAPNLACPSCPLLPPAETKYHTRTGRLQYFDHSVCVAGPGIYQPGQYQVRQGLHFAQEAG